METSGAKSSSFSFSSLVPYLYPLLFLPLDAATRIVQSPQGVVPWYPPAALTVVLLVSFGLRYALLALVTIAACNYFIWDFPPGPLNLGPLFLSVVSVSLYSAAAACLRYGARLHTDLARLRDAAWFVFAIVPTSVAAGSVYAAYLLMSGTIGSEVIAATIRDFALGDMIGIFTFAPVLFLIVRWAGCVSLEPPAADGQRVSLSIKRFARRQFAEFSAWLFVVVGALWITLEDAGSSAGNRLYLTFLPLIWAALRVGNRGSSEAVLLIACLTVGGGCVPGVPGVPGERSGNATLSPCAGVDRFVLGRRGNRAQAGARDVAAI